MGEVRVPPPALKILMLDGGAAASAGLGVLVLRGFLSRLHGFPLPLVTFLGCVNLAYACYSGSLAWRAVRGRRPSRRAIDVLIAANLAWALVCVAMVVRMRPSATIFGLAHVVFEGAFVVSLAYLEARWVRPHTI